MTSQRDKKSRRELGDKLRNTREQAKLTQVELANKAGIDPNYYARIERGEANPSFEKLQRIMKALKIKSLDIL